MVIRRPVEVNNLIEYYSNDLEENYEEEKEPIDIKFTK